MVNIEARSADLPPVAARPGRLDSLDLLRGLMVALMVLDHVREYFSAAALQFEPTNMLQTTPALFAARWVTHLCAPTFVLLSGLSVYLQQANGRTGNALRARLVTRGAWLILLEVTVIGFGFNFAEPFVFLQVIWAIGFGMIILAALTGFPPIVSAIVGVGLIVLNPILSQGAEPYLSSAIWHALFSPGPIAPIPGVAAYPALPWTGILLLGYGIGPQLLARRDRLARAALITAGTLLAAFVALRLAGVGDPRTFGVGPAPVLRALSFLNVSKYPPTPQYILLTLGTSALLLAAFAMVQARRFPMLRAFGRVPFFTYVVHIYVIHVSAMLVGLTLGMPASLFSGFIENSAPLKDAGWGFSLPWVLVVWAATLLALRPLSIWFAGLKSRRSEWWLSYL